MQKLLAGDMCFLLHPDSVAEQQILKQFRPEAQSFATGNLAAIMDQSIKALGA